MYCPSCGTEYTIELKYCNRCGANLSAGLEQQTQLAPISVTKPVIAIAAAMVILTVLGFGLLITGAVELSHSARIEPDSVTAIVIVGMLTILTMDIFLVRQLSKLINASLSARMPAQPHRQNLPNPSMVRLPRPSTERLQAVPSVTEGTTRFLEPSRAMSEAEGRATAENVERKLDR
jgi:hypothetical protein